MSGKQGLEGFEGNAPLPSAPPPCYEDAIAQASSQPYGTPYQPSSVPLMANESYVQARPPPVQTPGGKAYPVQQVAPVPPPLPQGGKAYPVQQVAPVPPPLPQVTVTMGGGRLPVGRRPLKTTCPQCHASISTRTQVKNACRPTFWCVLMFLTVVCALCSCCPYLLCQKPLRVDHFCPRCNAFLGSYIDNC